MSQIEKTRRRNRSELYIALRYKVRAKGISRVNMIRFERDLNIGIPDIKAKIPVEVILLDCPTQADKLGEARLWDGFEERAWRERSPERLQRRLNERTEDFRRRLTEGELAMVAIWKGEYVGAAWFCLRGRKDDPVVSSFVELRPREAFLYQSQVDRAFRGNHIYSMLISAGLRQLKERGYQKVSVHVEDDNAPSIIAIESLGFKPVRLIRFRRLFSLVRREETDLGRD